MPWNAVWYLYPADLTPIIRSIAFDLDLKFNVSLSDGIVLFNGREIKFYFLLRKVSIKIAVNFVIKFCSYDQLY